MEVCVICQQPLGKYRNEAKGVHNQPCYLVGDLPCATLTDKGCASINKAIEEREDANAIQPSPRERIHQDCRRNYCKPDQVAKSLRIKQGIGETAFKRPALRSDDDKFSFKSNCFFCGQQAMAGNKRKAFDVISVRTIEYKDTVLTVCRERNDSWAHSVLARISSAHDLHAADAIYHKACDINFRTMRPIPTAFRKEELTAKKVKLGRPEELDRTEAFLEVAHFLEENDDEQITISDLTSKMEAILDGSEYSAYSRVHVRSKLKEHFGDNIVRAHINGKSDVVTFRNTAATILQDFYNSRQKPDLSTDKIRLVQTASKLIKSDTKLVETENSCYPSYDDFESQDKCIAFLPEITNIA